VKTMPEQRSTGSAAELSKVQRTPNDSCNWAWVKAEVWTERMLSALGNGVKAANGTRD